MPLVIGAGAGPKTFAWIAAHADGWMTTPIEQDISAKCAALRTAWAEAGRDGEPQVHVLIASKPSPEDLAGWAEAGATDLIWGVPDKSEDEVMASLDRLADRIGLTAGVGTTAGSVA